MSIKILYEISSLVTKKQVGSHLLVPENEDFETGLKYQRLIEGLTRQSWESDDEARQDLYGQKAGAKTFEMLKSRAKERLISMIFMSENQKNFTSTLDKAYFNCCKAFLTGVLLFNKSKLSSGHDQLKGALKLAREFQFHSLEILILGQLRKLASFTGSEKLYYKYLQELRHVHDIVKAELEAEDLDFELQVFLVKSVQISSDWLKILENNYSKMILLKETFSTNSIIHSYYRIAIRYFQAKEDYKRAIELCEELQKYYVDNPRFFVKLKVARAVLNKLYCALYLKDYKAGNDYAKECELYIEEDSLNWLIFKENHFLLCMHTAQFAKASEIYNQVLQNPTFSSYPTANIEKWRIYEAYLEYATQLDPLVNRRKFNISKFLNEVPVYSKDKSGYNLSIIISQILLSIKTHDLSRVIDRAEPLKIYLSRYVKKDRNPRSYYFLKMLEVMIRYEFSAEKTEQIADKFFQKLLQSGHSGPESSEVIPYEWLWTDLLGRLRELKTNPIKGA
jgi:hypothetical protein